MGKRWIRLDVDWSDSEWLYPLSDRARYVWVELLAYVKRSGLRGRVKACAPSVFAGKLRTSADAVVELIGAALEHGALRVDGADWIITKWDDYQEVDPTAAARMRKYRGEKSAHKPLRRVTRNNAEHRNVTVRSDVTRRVTETETETETKIPIPSSPAAKRKKPECPIPENWMPNKTHVAIADRLNADLVWEAEAFRDHAETHDRRCSDWDAAFRTWLKKSRQFHAGPASKPTEPAPPKRYKIVPAPGDTPESLRHFYPHSIQ